MSAKIVTPVPNANNTAEAMVVEEEDSECEGLRTEVEDMDSEEGINVEDLVVEDTDEVDMVEEVMVVVEEEEEDMVEGEDMVVRMEDMVGQEGWVEEEVVVNLILLMISPIIQLLVESLPTRFMCRMYSLPFYCGGLMGSCLGRRVIRI
jgi:hypothetical protein